MSKGLLALSKAIRKKCRGASVVSPYLEGGAAASRTLNQPHKLCQIQYINLSHHHNVITRKKLSEFAVQTHAK